VSASPSGSDDKEPSKFTGIPVAPVYGPPAFAVGGRFTSVTVIAVLAEPERAFAAVNVTLYVPDWEKVGVQLNVPDVWAAFDVNVAPDGSGEAVRLVMASPSGSDADTVKVISVFSAPETVAGAVTTGLRSILLTMMLVVAEPERAFVAVKVTL